MPELDLLRQIAPGVAAPSAEARARARDVLLHHIARAEPRRRPPRRRLLVLAAGLAATAVAAAAVFLGVGTDRDESASAATAALRDAAAVARAQPAPPALEPGEYRYTRSVNAYLVTTVLSEENFFSVLVPRIREIWLGPNGGRLHETSGKPTFLSERDRERWIAAGRPRLRERESASALPPAAPLDLPTDPDALYRRLKREATGHGDGLHEEMFTLVGDALRETNGSPAQRAALYEVAARIPGVDLLGRVTDHAGRSGIAVAFASDPDKQRHTLIFDPDTAALLGEEYVALAGNANGYPEGTVIGYATYVATGIVDSIRARPPTRS